jgi:CBS domain-containing protein
VGPNQDLAYAHQLMMWSNVRHLPVVDGSRLVGMLSDRQLLEAVLSTSASTNVYEVMAPPKHVATPEEDLGHAAARMAAARLDALPVLADDKIVGILTTTDVLAERGKLFFKGGKLDVPDVGTIMRRPVKAAHVDDGLDVAIGTMVEEDIRHLPVIDADRHVVGLLSDRDVRSAVGDPIEALRAEEGITFTVEDVMNRSPMVIAHDASLVDLAACFLDDRVGALPVVDEDEVLVGIVSYVDLLRHVVATRST